MVNDSIVYHSPSNQGDDDGIKAQFPSFLFVVFLIEKHLGETINGTLMEL